VPHRQGKVNDAGFRALTHGDEDVRQWRLHGMSVIVICETDLSQSDIVVQIAKQDMAAG
jgi:hypothetical protein